jgi:hypothetical protein
VLTIGGGEARLNAAFIDCAAEAKRSFDLAPQCLLRTLADCIGARDSARSFSVQRPILPAPILRVLGELPLRARSITCFEAERDALRALEQRLQGGFVVAHPSTPCRASDLVCRQLGLLGALVTIEGNAEVERYFESNLERFRAQPEFRSALSAWRRERKLHPCDGQRRGRQDAQRERESATRARVAQARLELRRRGRTVGLAFALDAVCAAPEAPEAWLLLAELRAAEARGSAALCFSEAICAARGAEETIERVQKQLRISSEAELARYFRAHGDFAVADWLEAGSVRSATPLPAISH